MLLEQHLIIPDWPAPPNVRALQTTRQGGSSLAPYDSLNLGEHTGDDALRVAANRQRLNPFLPTEPLWLEQVHGVTVVNAAHANCLPQADAAYATAANAVCTVLTADCLPVLLCDDLGSVVGAAHAGWRGLAAGVIEATVSAMQVPPERIIAWLGPAIGPQAFEVGDDVRTVFVVHDTNASAAFTPSPSSSQSEGGEYLADIYLLARQRLQALGITQIYGGGYCTYSEHGRFFSYRRDGDTGRMASMIWLSTST